MIIRRAPRFCHHCRKFYWRRSARPQVEPEKWCPPGEIFRGKEYAELVALETAYFRELVDRPIMWPPASSIPRLSGAPRDLRTLDP